MAQCHQSIAWFSALGAMLSWLGLARKAAEKQSGSLVKPSNQTGAAMPRQQRKRTGSNDMIKHTAESLLSIANFYGADITRLQAIDLWADVDALPPAEQEKFLDLLN
jgi:hypothetical protein